MEYQDFMHLGAALTPEMRRHARLLIQALNGPVHIYRIEPEACPHCGNNLDPRAGQWAAHIPGTRTTYCSTFAAACLVAREYLAQQRRAYSAQHNG